MTDVKLADGHCGEVGQDSNRNVQGWDLLRQRHYAEKETEAQSWEGWGPVAKLVAELEPIARALAHPWDRALAKLTRQACADFGSPRPGGAERELRTEENTRRVSQ